MQDRRHGLRKDFQVKKTQRLVRSLVCAALTLSGVAVVHAHGGLSIDADICKLRVGNYNMHFAGYQPGLSGVKEFCEDIPATGPTTVVMDAIDAELREMPIEVRVVFDTGDGKDREAKPVVHLPPKVYPGGSMTFEYTFEKPGNYVGYVIGGERGEHVARFPFSVGVSKGPWGSLLMVAGFVAAAVMIYAYTVRAGRKRAAARRYEE